MGCGEGDDHPRLGDAATAGDLHRPLARQRVARHVLPSGPNLRQEVFVAVTVEDQTAAFGRRLGIIGQGVDDGGVLPSALTCGSNAQG